ncbi:hypothetical protein BN1002_01476 [Bacillus sp. B-jedd]|nr:hypothetical protein BN1002_01476 [Bacillus sp. B-jedd]
MKLIGTEGTDSGGMQRHVRPLERRKRLRDRQKTPRDRQKASVPAKLIPGSFPLCPCDDYSRELSLVVSPDQRWRARRGSRSLTSHSGPKRPRGARRSSKKLSLFLRSWVYAAEAFPMQLDKQASMTPRRLHGPPRGKHVPGVEIDEQG